MWIYIYYFKLVWVVFVKKGYGHTHNPIIVAGDVGRFVHVDCFVVVVGGVLLGGVVFVKYEFFVLLLNIKISKPRYTRHPNHTLSVVACGCHVLVLGIEMTCATLETIAQPQFVIPDERKYLFVGYGVLVPHYHKLFIILNQLGNILTEEREWWVGNNNVGLFEQLDALGAAEVAIPFERSHLYFARIGHIVAIFVAIVDLIDRLLAGVHREQINILALVAGGDYSFESEVIELQREVLEEVAHSWVIAVAEYCFATKMLFVVDQFTLNVGELSVELILLGGFGGRQGGVCHRVWVLRACNPLNPTTKQKKVDISCPPLRS